MTAYIDQPRKKIFKILCTAWLIEVEAANHALGRF